MSGCANAFSSASGPPEKERCETDLPGEGVERWQASLGIMEMVARRP
jgi:hypothetical protein